jgi:hypothetical protein
MRVRSGRVLRRREPRRQKLARVDVTSTDGPALGEAVATTWGSVLTVFMALMKHPVAVELL